MFKHLYPLSMIKEFYQNNFSLELSTSFINCADYQLTTDLYLKTGVHINKNVGIGLGGKNYFFYKKGEISRMFCFVCIYSFANNAEINWKSKSGRIYNTFDTDIDCDDIEFWFEGLDPLEYQKQLHPDNPLPFTLKDLSYELVVSALNMNMTIEMYLKHDNTADTSQLIEKIDKMMDDYNMRSMKNDRGKGVVHNWKRRIGQNRLIYDIDTGSAGLPFLKKLLVFLSKLARFSKIEVS